MQSKHAHLTFIVTKKVHIVTIIASDTSGVIILIDVIEWTF